MSSDKPKRKNGAPAVVLDRERLVRLLRAGAFAWEHRLFGFAGMMPPEERHRPGFCQEGSLDHALYLFAATAASRSGATAEEVIGGTRRLFVEYPEFVNPQADPSAWETPEFELAVAKWLPMAEDDKDRIEGWRQNLRVLRDVYHGDPRNMLLTYVPLSNCFADIMTARADFLDTVRKQFYGWDHKLLQLLGLWMQSVDWMEHQEQWERLRLMPLIAVDLWLMRWVKQMDLVVSYRNDNRDTLARPISDIMCELCLSHDISWVNAGQGLWHSMAHIDDRRRRKSDMGRATRHCLVNCPFHHVCTSIVPAPVRKEDEDGSVPRESTMRGSMQFARAEPRVLEEVLVMGNQWEIYAGPLYQRFFQMLGPLPEIPRVPRTSSGRPGKPGSSAAKRKSAFVPDGAHAPLGLEVD